MIIEEQDFSSEHSVLRPGCGASGSYTIGYDSGVGLRINPDVGQMAYVKWHFNGLSTATHRPMIQSALWFQSTRRATRIGSDSMT